MIPTLENQDVPPRAENREGGPAEQKMKEKTKRASCCFWAAHRAYGNTRTDDTHRRLMATYPGNNQQGSVALIKTYTRRPPEFQSSLVCTDK